MFNLIDGKVVEHVHNSNKYECSVCGLTFAHIHKDITKPKEWQSIAIPIAKEVSEDELWNEHLDELSEICMQAPLKEPERRNEILGKLKSKYNLIRKH